MRKKHRITVWHPAGLTKEVLQHRVSKPRPAGAVTAGEFADDLLAFIRDRYGDRHLDVEVAQLALSNVAHRMIMLHLRLVAAAHGTVRQVGPVHYPRIVRWQASGPQLPHVGVGIAPRERLALRLPEEQERLERSRPAARAD